MLRYFVLGVLLLAIGHADVAADTPTHADVRYGKYHRNVLDVYVAQADKPTPALIYFHGGGWMAGDKRSVRPTPFVANGITVVAANYRYTIGSPDAAPYPAQLDDARRVVQFVRSQAEEWNIDPDRIGLTGGSAGAVMCMWIGYRDDMANPQAEDAIERLSTRVRCILPLAGPTIMDPDWIAEHIGGPPDIHPAVYPFFNVARISDLERDGKREIMQQASPVTHVSADDPPTFLQYFSPLDDTPLPKTADWNQSIHHARFGLFLKQRLDAVGVENVLRYRGHDGEQTMDGFLRRHLLE